MKNTSSDKKKKIIFVAILLLVMSVVFFSAKPSGYQSRSANLLSRTFSRAGDGINSVFSWVGSFFAANAERGSLQDSVKSLSLENARLKQQIDIYKKQSEAFIELKKDLNLKTYFDGFSLVGGELLQQGKDPLFGLLRVAVGTADGLYPNQDGRAFAIDGERNLLGVIYAADLRECKVLPLYSENFTAVVRKSDDASQNYTMRGGEYLYRDKVCIVEGTSENFDLKKGDMLCTSGRGGVFPDGLLVGKVREVVVEPHKIYAVVTPSCDFTRTRFVFLLQNALTGEKDSDGENND